MYDPVTGYAPAVLITGATGAIGRAVGRELVVHGYRVLGLVRDDDAKARLPYAVVPVLGHIRNPVAWESAIVRSDAVIHLAIPDEITRGRRERDQADRDADELAEILDRLCTVVRRNKKRFIHTFGALLYEPNEGGWISEASPISSGKGYGIRHRKTYPILSRHRKKGLKAITVNPAFVYGQGGWYESSVLEPMSRGESTMIGDGTQTMHYIEASDAARGYRLALEAGLDGDDYLLADDEPSTSGELIRLTAKEMGAPEPKSIPEENLIPILGGWGLEAVTFCPKVDSSRARERLGWTPRYHTIREGVPAVVREWRRTRREPAASFQSGTGALKRPARSWA